MALFYTHAVQEQKYFAQVRVSEIIPVLSGFYQSFCKVHSSSPQRFAAIKDQIDNKLCDMYNSD